MASTYVLCNIHTKSQVTILESGLVYGNAQGSIKNQVDNARVFDCLTKTMYKLFDRSTRVYSLKKAETKYSFVDLSANRYPFL